MDRGPGMVERLREQLDALEQRQRARAGSADPSFWDRAREQVRRGARRASRARLVAPESRPVRCATGAWTEVPPERLERLSPPDLDGLAWSGPDVFDDPGWVAAVEAESVRRSDAE